MNTYNLDTIMSGAAMEPVVLAARVGDAAKRIQGKVYRTPMLRSAFFSQKAGCDCYLKLESEQVTGSFKVRGATNKLLRLAEADATALFCGGIYSSSSGNHALALTHALEAGRKSGQLPKDVQTKIYVPETVAPSKLAMLKLHGASIEIFGNDCEVSEGHARSMATKTGGVYVPPYNDEDIIAGQGTVALEMLEQVPDLDAVFVAVGGGGLLSGIAGYVKHTNPNCLVIGCSPELSACMELSVASGRLLQEGEFCNEDTLSDGTAGGIESGAITFPACSALVDRWISVSEAEIATAVYDCLAHEHKVVEGAAGVALAGMLKAAPGMQGKELGVVVCGNNIGAGVLAKILSAQHDSVEISYINK